MYLHRGMGNAGARTITARDLRCAKAAAGWGMGETTARCIDNCGGGEEREKEGWLRETGERI